MSKLYSEGVTLVIVLDVIFFFNTYILDFDMILFLKRHGEHVLRMMRKFTTKLSIKVSTKSILEIISSIKIGTSLSNFII